MMIIKPMFQSKDIIFPGTLASAWTVMNGVNTGKPYKNSDDALVPFFFKTQVTQLSKFCLLYEYIPGQ
jgi:hypothetical protein